MLIVPDVEDVYTPLQTDVVVQLSEVSSRLLGIFPSFENLFNHMNQYLDNG